MINKIAIEGEVVSDVRFVNDRYTMIGFNIKNSFEIVNKKTQQEVTTETYFSVVMWGTPAMAFEGKINKGDIVRVGGRVKWDSYKNKEGVDKNAIGIVADRLEVVPQLQPKVVKTYKEDNDLPF